MLKTISILTILILLFSTVCYGGEIELKKSFWKGYFYIKDGVEHRVGDGRGLRQDMAGIKEAQKEIDKYRRRRGLYICFGLMTWTSIVAMYGRNISRGYSEWDGTQTFLYVSGLSMFITGRLLYPSANSHLKKGVSIYNQSLKKEQTTTQRLNFVIGPTSGGLSFAVKYNF